MLTRYNIMLHVPVKKIIEKYMGINNELSIGETYTFEIPLSNGATEGKFIFNDMIKEIIVKAEFDSKPIALEFVGLVAHLTKNNYSQALQLINKDFNLGLTPSESETESYSQERKLALENGVFENTYNPEEGLPANKKEALLYLHDIELIGFGGINLIIGQPGVGKSNICEAICTIIANQSVDGLGFNLNEAVQYKALYIDMERSERHLHQSWARMKLRSKKEGLNEANEVIFLSYKRISNRQAMRNRLVKLERDVIQNKPTLLLIDGVAKLVDDINNLNQCVEFVRWLSDLAEENNLGVVLTIHANPSDMKAQGHLGSVLLRECESVLALKYEKTGSNTQRLLTTDFQHGKVRGDSDKVESCFEWNNEEEFFVSAKKKSQKQSSEESLKNAVIKAFEGKGKLTYTELSQSMSMITGNSVETERKKISDLKLKGLIKQQDNFYVLNTAIDFKV